MKKILAWLPLIATVALADACTHEIQSPLPQGTGVAPDLTCAQAAQATDPMHMEHDALVVLSGQSFTPMPSRTLADPRALILPKITLSETSAIGAAASTPFVIADDPLNPGAATNRVQWASEQSMSFTIKPSDGIATGVFDITVTNPDGRSVATYTKALAVLPPPTIAMVKPPSLCDDQADQQVVITGTNFLVYDGQVPTVTVGSGADAKTYTPTVDMSSCTPLDGTFTEKNVELCTSITITIKVGDFPVTMPTKVPVVVQNPPPADCASSEAVTLTVEPPPEVDSVTPATVCEGGSQLTINGKNFEPMASASLDCNGTSTTAMATTVTPDGMQIAATFGGGAVPGSTCDVIVQNPDGCQDRPLPHKQVTVVTGPILFYADPPVVYNGINTRVTLYATTITPPLPADAVTMVVNGTTQPVTQLVFNTVTGHPNRLQAIVPASQPPGVYDITLKDSSGCFATLPKAITVTGDLTVTLEDVIPPFGDTSTSTAVTLFRDTAAPAPANKPFVATPRVFLNPDPSAPTDVAVEMTGVSFVDGDTATGVVPSGTPVHGYDVVLVNPDGSVGVLKNGYAELANAPPVITSATPSSIVNATGQQVVLAGTGFAAGDMVSLTCASGMMPMATAGAPTCGASGCTQTITINGSSLAVGDVCVVRLTNPDGSYGDYSAVGVTGPSLNTSAPVAGSAMNIGRRALAAAAGNATAAARFVYAVGGDTGVESGALDSVELAPVDVFGKIGAWTVQPPTLGAKRTLAGATTVGRYVYLVGGDDGTGPVATAERALILSPSEAPVIEDVDLALDVKGLDAGQWHYRISAVFAASDTDNPGGESLASDELSIKLPSFPGKKIPVTLSWQAPQYASGVDVPGVVGYDVYRTAMVDGAPGTEVLLATVMGAKTFTDDGSAMPGTQKPLPTGSTGNWAELPIMATKRSGPGVAAGWDPSAPETFYVYALLGKNSTGTAAASVNTSYEYLPVTVDTNGRQTVGAAWKTGAHAASAGRWQVGAWTVDKTVEAPYAPDTWIYVGGGFDGSDATAAILGNVEAGKITAGGDLGTFTSVKAFGNKHAGYGTCGANGQLFLFGGQNAAPSKGAESASLVTPAPGLANNGWNNEGTSLTHGRYLMGSTVQSSFIFLLGGQTDEPSAASTTTELLVW